MPKTDTLRKSPAYLRSPVSRGLKDGEKQIDRDGGDYGAGIIRGFAVVTRGEALGHDMWIDGDFLQQVADAINYRKLGSKSRFTHPGLSSDGMGKQLGRVKAAYVDGDVTRADLHFNESSHKTPDGDLATYIMDLAEEDPKAFGTSIVFAHDAEAEAEFEADNHTVDGFESPDPLNKQNYPHARLSELRAVDAVDDPAANPTGMFHREQDVAEEAWDVARFALGLTDELPHVAEFDIDPNRTRAFVARFLAKENLQIMAMPKSKLNEGAPVEETKPAETDPKETKPEEVKPEAEDEKEEEKPPEAKPVESQQSAKPDGKKFLEAFGQQGAVWFVEGKTFEECQQLHVKALADENAELKKRLAALKGGEKEAPEFSVADPKNADSEKLEQNLGKNIGQYAASIKLPGRSK